MTPSISGKPARYVFFITSLLFLWSLYPTGAQAREIDPYFQPLVPKLVAAKLDKKFVEAVFKSPCATFYPRVLVIRLTIRESKINYGQFLTAASVKRCKEFMKKHKKALERVEKEYKVSGEVLTAILLLETDLGNYTGSFPTLQTLATHAVAHTKEAAEAAYKKLPEKEKKRWTKQAAAERLGNRAAWSFGELKAFIQHLEKSKSDPCVYNGSYTGAIGLCQFQPSNIKPYGRDGNKDGAVDLFHVEDALSSAAAYLQSHGWRPNISRATQIKVVKTYNHSTPYAQTIVKLAALLRK
jgi:membrane-bound lytic murein transglycosylase B